MLGTLNAALEVRGIEMAPENISVRVEGENTIREGLPVLSKVRLHYQLKVPSGQRQTAERALAKHQARCPTAAWMKDAVEIEWDADIEEF